MQSATCQPGKSCAGQIWVFSVKVLYFSRDYSTHDRRFLAALAKTDHKVYYLRLERRGYQLEDRPLPPEIEVVPWVGGRAPARLSKSLALFMGLKRVIASIQPDLIQAGPIQTAAFLVALAGFHPLVSTSWGSDLLKDADRSALYRWATRFTLARSDVLVGDCDPVRQKAITFGMPDKRIITFPWGVDLHHYNPGPVPVGQNGPFTLLSTRGWEPIYGVDVLARGFVQAYQRLSQQGFNDLRLLMLGNGSQASLLHEIFASGGVLDQVHFPGQVAQSDLPRFYRQSDLYITASHSDGASISLLEAMACGRPVLVSDIPGNREFVQPGVQGWLFPDGDSQALADEIVRAVQGRDSLATMGSQARQLAEARADWEKNFQQLLCAYELAARHSRK